MTIVRKQAGARMSQAVTHGGVAYLAGQVGAGETVAEQTKAVLAQIDALLAECGTDKTKLLSATIWLTDMSTFAEMNSVWDAWVSAGNTPARACTEAALAAPQYKVEIMVVAAI